MRGTLLTAGTILLVGSSVVVCVWPAETKASAVSQAAATGKYENEVAAYEAGDRKSPPPQGAILFYGDSGIRKWTSLAKDFPDRKVINRGFGGSTMADALQYVDRIAIPYKPRLIIVREGGNDLTQHVTPEQVLGQFQALVDKVHAALPDTRIAFISFNPNPARWDQAELRKKANVLFKAYIAAKKNLDYIEVWDQLLGPDGKPREDLFVADRLHNNEAGYKLYADAVRPHLK